MSDKDTVVFREYGTAGPVVIVLHGGPGAPGSAALLAKGLAKAGAFRVLEPWQRRSGGERLTVTRHVEDLRRLIVSRCGGERPALVGESWGAMLALAYGAAHPDSIAAIALIGSGTWDKAARARLEATIDERMTPEMRQNIERLGKDRDDPLERMKRTYDIIRSLYLFDPIDAETTDDTPPFDERGHTETWADMVAFQEKGVYPAAFAAIKAPVAMFHGAYDPHPGPMIRDGLALYLPQLEYIEFQHCGHQPWLEKQARDEFFTVLAEWLARNCGTEETKGLAT